jgi:pSer/pThr/pTyr-binding forkhead associated (FHA) protein
MVGNSILEPLSRLVVTAPDALRGRVFVLDGRRIVVGREPAAEVFLDNPRVSRTHAALERFGGNMLVSDLGSRGGTTVNGRPIRDRQALRDGDVLGFASVEARYESAASRADETVQTPAAVGGRRPVGGQSGNPPAASSPDLFFEAKTVLGPAALASAAVGGRQRAGQRGSPLAASSPDARFDVGRQQQGHFNNVAGDQYNQYVQQIRQERASFLEEVAGARTRARRLIVLGFLLSLFGGGVYGWVVLRDVASISDLISSTSENPDPSFSPNLPRLFGPEVNGIPVGLIGFALAGLGSVLMLVGIVLHISAAARRRRRESEFAAALHLPPPYLH